MLSPIRVRHLIETADAPLSRDFLRVPLLALVSKTVLFACVFHLQVKALEEVLADSSLFYGVRAKAAATLALSCYNVETNYNAGYSLLHFFKSRCSQPHEWHWHAQAGVATHHRGISTSPPLPQVLRPWNAGAASERLQ